MTNKIVNIKYISTVELDFTSFDLHIEAKLSKDVV